MTIRERIRSGGRTLSIEFIAIWFAFWDKRVPWYVKFFLILPIAYIISPLDLISDTIPFLGQLDDIVALRVSYLIIKKVVDAEVMASCRQHATAFWDNGRVNRTMFWMAIITIWGLAVIVLVRYIVRKFINYF